MIIDTMADSKPTNLSDAAPINVGVPVETRPFTRSGIVPGDAYSSLLRQSLRQHLDKLREHRTTPEEEVDRMKKSDLDSVLVESREQLATKQRELASAVAKVDLLTKRLDERRNGSHVPLQSREITNRQRKLHEAREALALLRNSQADMNELNNQQTAQLKALREDVATKTRELEGWNNTVMVLNQQLASTSAGQVPSASVPPPPSPSSTKLPDPNDPASLRASAMNLFRNINGYASIPRRSRREYSGSMPDVSQAKLSVDSQENHRLRTSSTSSATPSDIFSATSVDQETQDAKDSSQLTDVPRPVSGTDTVKQHLVVPVDSRDPRRMPLSVVLMPDVVASKESASPSSGGQKFLPTNQNDLSVAYRPGPRDAFLYPTPPTQPASTLNAGKMPGVEKAPLTAASAELIASEDQSSTAASRGKPPVPKRTVFLQPNQTNDAAAASFPAPPPPLTVQPGITPPNLDMEHTYDQNGSFEVSQFVDLDKISAIQNDILALALKASETEVSADSSLPEEDSSGVDLRDALEGVPGFDPKRPIVMPPSAICKPGQPRRPKRRIMIDPHTLLLDAALEGDLEMVRHVIPRVPDLSKPNVVGITALHNAVCGNHFSVVQFLVQIGCDINAADNNGWTPIHCAAFYNDVPLCRYLVEHGANLSAMTYSDGQIPVQKCRSLEENYSECTSYLHAARDQIGRSNNGSVYALYKYSAGGADELSFDVSERLVVLRRGDQFEKDWWWARNARGATAYIPYNLVGLYPRIAVDV